MCGMKSMINRPGFAPNELKQILSDALFRKINAVGLNGGEPFLLNDLELYVDVLFTTLSKLKNVYIISNGYITNTILEKSKIILSMCHDHRAKLHLSISIDGYEGMQDMMRGKKGAFAHAVNTCRQIMENQSKYCDTFGTICTVTKVNVYHLAELDVWAQQNHIPISYNIATIHKRLCNENKYQDFSVLTDEHARLMAAEFFYSKYLETNKEEYFGLYYVIHTGKRIASCAHQADVVTLTPNGYLSYCATHSDQIGNAYEEKPEEIFFSRKNISYRNQLHSKYCMNCSQYSGSLNPKYYLSKYIKDRMRATVIYR
jgi:MoaA/NifB/PqqE/SkfB family radical SAM enzyme